MLYTVNWSCVVGKRNKTRSRGEVHYRFDCEIDLHGYTIDDALYRLEEDVIINAGCSILVVHGHGTGVLRKAIREFAESNKSVRSFDNGEDINLIGGSGVTVLYTC